MRKFIFTLNFFILLIPVGLASDICFSEEKLALYIEEFRANESTPSDDKAFLRLMESCYEKSENQKSITKFYYKMGSLYYYEKEFEKSIEYFEKSLFTAQIANLTDLEIEAYIFIGAVHSFLRNYGEASSSFQNALRLAINQNDLVARSSCNRFLGILFYNLGEYKLAIEYLTKMEWHTEEDKRIILDRTFFIINTLLALGRDEEASVRIKAFDDAKFTAKDCGSGFYYYTKAHYYSYRDQEKAIAYTEKCLNAYEGCTMYQGILLQNYLLRAKLYSQSSNFALADAAFNRVDEIAKIISYPLLDQIYLEKAAHEERKGNYKKATALNMKGLDYYADFQSKRYFESVRNANLSLETLVKEREILKNNLSLELNQSKMKEKYYGWFFTFCLVLFIFMAVVLWIVQVKRTRKNKMAVFLKYNNEKLENIQEAKVNLINSFSADLKHSLDTISIVNASLLNNKDNFEEDMRLLTFCSEYLVAFSEGIQYSVDKHILKKNDKFNFYQTVKNVAETYRRAYPSVIFTVAGECHSPHQEVFGSKHYFIKSLFAVLNSCLANGYGDLDITVEVAEKNLQKLEVTVVVVNSKNAKQITIDSKDLMLVEKNAENIVYKTAGGLQYLCVGLFDTKPVDFEYQILDQRINDGYYDGDNIVKSS